jgi:hypothetical protein
MKNINSRQLARTWPYTRYKSFEASLRKAAEQWFSERGCETHHRMGYCLARHDLWPMNLICEDVRITSAKNRRDISARIRFLCTNTCITG